MKRYLLFVFEYYYPSGGWTDYVTDSDTIEVLYRRYHDIVYADKYQIVDLETGCVVKRGNVVRVLDGDGETREVELEK